MSRRRDDENPDQADLRALTEVARRGSIAGAAPALGVSQQAVSARIRSLEARLGLLLLDRTTRGSHLTEAGDLVVAWGEEALAAWDRLVAGARMLRSTASPRLRVAASQTVAESLLPGWLLRLRAAEESAGAEPTAIDLSVGNSVAVAERVRRREADLGFVETPHPPTDLCREPVTSDEVAVVAATSHPWATRADPVGVAELAETDLVLREAGSGTRETFTDALAAASGGLAPTILVDYPTTASVRSAIIAGIAPGVLSRRLVRDDLVLGRLVLVETGLRPLVRDITAVTLPGSPARADARRLVAIASGQGERRGPGSEPAPDGAGA